MRATPGSGDATYKKGNQVAQRGGLGRGLEELLANSGSAETHPLKQILVAVSQTEVDDAVQTSKSGETVMTSELGAVLSARLADNATGLAIIYEALDSLVAEHALTDAAVVVDCAALGRQVFRAGRKPLHGPSAESLLDKPPGVYLEPPLPKGLVDTALVANLCTVALQMDALRHDAWHDELTGLLMRRSFDSLLECSVARANRRQMTFTLVVIDVDNLKEINDSQGHQAGDAALRALSARFQTVLRIGDNAARIGGDEFALILPDTDPDNVPMLLERVGAADVGNRSCPAFSYGVAQCPIDADSMDDLFTIADARLYEAKEARHSRSKVNSS